MQAAASFCVQRMREQAKILFRVLSSRASSGVCLKPRFHTGNLGVAHPCRILL